MRVSPINQWRLTSGSRDFTLAGIETSSWQLPLPSFNIHVVLFGLGFTLWLKEGAFRPW